MIKTTDQARDFAIYLTDHLVLSGLVKDCTDTDDNTEFDIQDAIYVALCRKFKIDEEE